ncbi:ATP-dependent 6-phosphofructokinase [Solimonas soli]|uniref:ATP-dependent 6-phosphofructokinase n=1 Tax=Solimonas soli TaxID=413479 RepID=UPI000483366D|nr:ATP-dependent 6-phosphofructokinase [Solimonas soli]
MANGAGLRVGVLTSGGDCAGLDAALLTVARGAGARGWRLFGIEDGTLGLLAQPPRCVELDGAALDTQMLRRGGSCLGTVSTGDPLHFPLADGSWRDRSEEFIAGVRALRLDVLIAIGGDGSMRIVSALCERAALPMVGVPKTIDNDVRGTETTIGFATAVQCVSDALDRLQSTAASHHRVLVLEVMGREAGHLALHGGIAGGADLIAVPELGLDLQCVAADLRRCLASPRRYALVVVAEGLAATVRAARREGEGTGAWLARMIEGACDCTARATVLGHLQRGGAPCAQDRLVATALAAHAVRLVEEGRYGRMAAWQDGRLSDVPISLAASGPRALASDDPRIDQAHRLGISLAVPRGAASPAA